MLWCLQLRSTVHEGHHNCGFTAHTQTSGKSVSTTSKPETHCLFPWPSCMICVCWAPFGPQHITHDMENCQWVAIAMHRSQQQCNERLELTVLTFLQLIHQPSWLTACFGVCCWAFPNHLVCLVASSSSMSAASVLFLTRCGLGSWPSLAVCGIKCLASVLNSITLVLLSYQNACA